jgi:uncharacterized membrane protein YgcG
MATMTMNQRRMLDALAASREEESGGVVKKVGMGLAVLAILALLVLWLMGFFSTPKEVLEIRAMVDQQIVELQRVARNEVPMSYGSSSFGPMFERMRDMPEKTREQLRGEMDRLFRARERAELQSYFALPADQRRAELDRRIKAEEARRKAWQEQRANRGGNNGGGRGNATAGGPPGGGGGPQRGGGGGPGGGRSEDGRNTRAKQRIDSSTPEQRAQTTEYRRVMEERRQQLGLPSGRGRGG